MADRSSVDDAENKEIVEVEANEQCCLQRLERSMEMLRRARTETTNRQHQQNRAAINNNGNNATSTTLLTAATTSSTRTTTVVQQQPAVQTNNMSFGERASLDFQRCFPGQSTTTSGRNLQLFLPNTRRAGKQKAHVAGKKVHSYPTKSPRSQGTWTHDFL